MTLSISFYLPNERGEEVFIGVETRAGGKIGMEIRGMNPTFEQERHENQGELEIVTNPSEPKQTRSMFQKKP